jgi:hypothetical protein
MFTHKRLTMQSSQLRAGVFIPIPRTEPTSFGIGIPVRFDREPEKFKFQFKILVQSVQIGIPVRFDREPTVEQKNRIGGEFDVFSNLIKILKVYEFF